MSNINIVILMLYVDEKDTHISLVKRRFRRRHGKIPCRSTAETYFSFFYKKRRGSGCKIRTKAIVADRTDASDQQCSKRCF